MKKQIISTLFIFLLSAQGALCEVASNSPALETSLKSESAGPGFFQIVFALVFVVCLIYITGLIYSKLNIVGTNAVKEQLKNCDMDRAIVISTTQLGQNKNLHVIELNNKRFLIGAAESITLLKELGTKEVRPQEIKPEKVEESVEEPVEEFDVHKKYL